MGRSSDAKKARRAKRQSKRATPGAQDEYATSGPGVTFHDDPDSFADVLSRADASAAELGLCTGLEVEHEDGVTECSLGAGCIDPGSLHPTGASCTMAPADAHTHECAACSR